LPAEGTEELVEKAHEDADSTAAALADRQPDPVLEEVRVAMAWNGGVSLAVWMGGVAVEIDAARRASPQATAGNEPTLQVYAAICEAFRRRLVVDVLCGASAGGLNGGLLAAAIRKGRRLPVGLIRQKWIDIGEFSNLLQPLSNANPKSVMRGGTTKKDPGVFYAALRKFFAAILDDPGEGDGDERKACEVPGLESADIALDVMVTDVAGEPRRFRDEWGFDLAAREYRSPLRFRHADDFTLDALTTGARASASFPVAFEPVPVAGDAAARAGFLGTRYAVDGGLLENAPIKYALETIPDLAASMQVKRYLCYVNAAPPKADPADPQPDPPTLLAVLGWTVNIPRDGRFVDQLYALEDETRRSLLTSKLQPDLLRLPLSALGDVATGLLRTYRLRRLAMALEEIAGDPASATGFFRAVTDADPDAAAVGWLPTSVAPPATAQEWRWGIRAAERILHLELDILRGPLTKAPVDARRRILEAKIEIEAQLGKLIVLRKAALAVAQGLAQNAPESLLSGLDGLDGSFRAKVWDALDATWEPFSRVLDDPDLADIDGFGVFAAALLQGPDELTPKQRFLERALSVEVVRRAFAADEAVDAAKRLLFAQLTPLARTEILRWGPGPEEVPNSGEDKLTGIRLGHFAGFYRRSWRANDFMWGRLDGATRIVDMLIDHARVRQLDELGEPVDWSAFATALLAVGAAHAATRDQVVREALGGEAAGGDLTGVLASALENDLTSGNGTLARNICARLAQLEILADDLPTLVDETANDEKLGCYTSPLDIKPRADLTGAIETLRDEFRSGKKGRLPCLLGRDSGDESVSDLALNTVSRTMIVALATLRSLNVVLGKILAVGRVPLLPMTGMTSRHRWLGVIWERIGVIGTFAGATTYIALRLTTATDHDAPVGALWSPPVLLSWVDVLIVAGVFVVPGVRLMKVGGVGRKLVQGFGGGLILLTAIAIPVFLVACWGHFSFVEVLATGGAKRLPGWVTWLALTAPVASVPVLRLNPLPGKKRLIALAEKYLPLSVLLGAIGAVVFGWASWDLAASFGSFAWWQIAAAASAWASIGLLIVYLVFGSRR
jgi:predicted acylesterase/phospholipase RssA